MRLFCVRDGRDGVTVETRIFGRQLRTETAMARARELEQSGKWTRVVGLDADDALGLQAAAWSSHLLTVNPGYVTDPSRLVGYVRGPNWDDPGSEYAHYSLAVAMYGREILREFASYREVPRAEAEQRLSAMLHRIGIATRASA